MKTLPLAPVRYGEPLTATRETEKKPASTGFGEVLQKSIETVNGRMEEAAAMSEGLVTGQHGNIHETMIAIEKAGISFRLMTKVQQKAIQAYQEVMRIQL